MQVEICVYLMIHHGIYIKLPAPCKYGAKCRLADIH